MQEPITFPQYESRLHEFILWHSQTAPEASGVSSRELGTGFNELALALFSLQFDHVLPYRRFCQARGQTPEAVATWPEIPAIPTAAFKEFDLSSLAEERRVTIFHSSGTTGQRPSRHSHSAESLAIYEKSILPWFQRHLLPEFPPAPTNENAQNSAENVGQASSLPVHGASSPRVSGGRMPPEPADKMSAPPCRTDSERSLPMEFLILTPPPTIAPHSSLVYMFETARREFGSANSRFAGTIGTNGAWGLDLDGATEVLQKSLSANRPLVLLGTAFLFVDLLDHLRASNLSFRLPGGSRVLETGGYKGRSRALPKAELHALLTRLLGVPESHVVSEYGMSELSSQAYDRALVANPKRSTLNAQPGRRHFRFPPWAQVQVVSPETGREVAEGETGLIRVFDLANVRSVMAIQTEDLGIRRAESFELIGRAELAEPRGCSLMST